MGDAGNSDEQPLSARLRALPDNQPMSISDLARELGTRVHGLALLILALPEALPLPLPSMAAILGLPMAAVSFHLMLNGENGRLPAWLGRYPLSPSLVTIVRTRLADLVARGERLSRPRWTSIVGRDRAVGGLCLLLSMILLLPLPLFNMAPAACLALLAWGLLRRDGLFVVIGVAGSVLVLASLILALSGLAWWLEGT
ncbi:exopolysaccharide biosynthesis protein [Paracoccus benzoatiresistens]|uniref:Exopolysaccharide biosynthesis protein n=1 Tax=Paracoccus benzoatiresistens TaxID=2997341 RepID=A0ABT4J9B7_9RHOB|nr:exopolysaccharide biosynthesis protein [Paracoccus sp. EF6]MCZ0963192.1 exopolysaccharide biosynthesis protein [Paracoccus sp. EF6]